jgi:hypothetical protein
LSEPKEPTVRNERSEHETSATRVRLRTYVFRRGCTPTTPVAEEEEWDVESVDLDRSTAETDVEKSFDDDLGAVVVAAGAAVGCVGC